MSQKKPRLFGTDGIRGTFGEPPLDEPTVRRLGVGLARYLKNSADAPRVVIGGDTRFSTPTVCAWLATGLASHGVEITYAGTVTTPCVAQAARDSNAVAGVAVSASHNPFSDNGIKLIDADGFKWSPEAEAEVEELLFAVEDPGDGLVELAVDPEPLASYVVSLRKSLAGQIEDLVGLRVALDTANGAASSIARQLFTGLGAMAVIRHHKPDGRNINLDCGSTHPEVIAEMVRREDCDLGFAFDGDADRVVLADETGEVRDGDAILYLWARDLAQKDALPSRRIVATSMSNLGLEAALRREEIAVERCGVGDREVVARMRQEGIVLGGEQSGHIVNLDLSTTGDGLLTALQLAALRQRSGKPLSAMLNGFSTYPQLIRNVKVRHKPPLETLPAVQEASDVVRQRLGDSGRLVLRYSGTEPLVRIMIEGREQAVIEELAEQLAGVLAEELS